MLRLQQGDLALHAGGGFGGLGGWFAFMPAMSLGGEWGVEPTGVWAGELWGVSGPSWFKGSTTSCKDVSTSSSKSPTNTESFATGRSFFLYSLLGNSGMIGNPPIFFTYALVCLLRSLTTSLSTKYKCSFHFSSGVELGNKLILELHWWSNFEETGFLGQPCTGGPPSSAKNCWGLEICRQQQQGILPNQRSQLAHDCLV